MERIRGVYCGSYTVGDSLSSWSINALRPSLTSTSTGTCHSRAVVNQWLTGVANHAHREAAASAAVHKCSFHAKGVWWRRPRATRPPTSRPRGW
jgi:hypothetical protein